MRRVPAAKPGRESIDIEIFGMAGIPDEFEREVKGRLPICCLLIHSANLYMDPLLITACKHVYVIHSTRQFHSDFQKPCLIFLMLSLTT